MHTGYTDKITADMSLRDFVLICAHAFGASMQRRDSGIDLSWPQCEPSSYHADKLIEERAELDTVRGWTVDEAEDQARAEVARQLKSREETVRRSDEARERYERMLGLVREWEPPSGWSDLKRFMIEQITSSIEADCWTTLQINRFCKVSVGLLGDAWREERIADLTRSVAYHAAEHEKEVERCKTQQAMINSLRENLEDK